MDNPLDAPRLHNPGDALPGNRSPYELASMLKHMGLSHASFGWAAWLVYAANTIAHLATPETEKAWRAKHGNSVFFTEDEEASKARINREFASFFAFDGARAQFEGREETRDQRLAAGAAAQLPQRPVRAVLAKDGPASAPTAAPPTAAPTKRAVLKKEEPSGGTGFFS